MILNSIRRLFSYDLGVDLGTAYTSVYVKGKGIVANEPSVIVIKDDGKEARQVVAVGGPAKDMVGRTPTRINAIRPMKDGVIADFQAAQMMLEYFIKKANNNRKGIVKSRIVLSVPIEINEIEKKALIESAKVAGASEVYLLEAVIGAAIGAGLSVEEPVGNMIVDIGAGKTEVAVISLGGIVIGKSVTAGGDSMDQAIVHYIKSKYNRVIGERTAESVKIKLGQTLNNGNSRHIKMNLSDLSIGMSSTMDISSEEVNEALTPTISSIIATIRQTFEVTPPQLVSDIADNGITLTGGGALLGGLDKLIQEETGLLVRLADQPLLCVVLGLGKALDNFDFLRGVS
jgi:rod shape-determining protein MreB